jgi:hypothetical protein
MKGPGGSAFREGGVVERQANLGSELRGGTKVQEKFRPLVRSVGVATRVNEIPPAAPQLAFPPWLNNQFLPPNTRSIGYSNEALPSESQRPFLRTTEVVNFSEFPI